MTVDRSRLQSTGLVLLAAVLAALLIAALHVDQRQRMEAGGAQLEQLGRAEKSLGQGFMHHTLGADGAEGPWNRASGRQLLQEGVAGHREVLARLPQDLPSLPAQAEQLEAFARLLERLDAAPPGTPGLESELRRSMHALTDSTAQLRRDATAAQETLGRRLEMRFHGAIGLSVLLLAGLAAAFYRSDRERIASLAQARQAEHAVRESEATWRAMVSALDEGVLIFDARGALVNGNPAAERILGLTQQQLSGAPDQAAGWPVTRLDGSTLPPREMPLARALRSGQPVADELLGYRRPDGRGVWLRVSAVPLFEADGGTLRGAVVSFSDFTERKRVEDDLAAHKASLEQRVAERTSELERALAAQRESDRFAQVVADQQPTLIAYTDRTLHLRFANRAYLEWHGVSEAHALGAPLRASCPPRNCATSARCCSRCCKAMRPAARCRCTGTTGAGATSGATACRASKTARCWATTSLPPTSPSSGRPSSGWSRPTPRCAWPRNGRG